MEASRDTHRPIKEPKTLIIVILKKYRFINSLTDPSTILWLKMVREKRSMYQISILIIIDKYSEYCSIHANNIIKELTY